MRRIPLGPGESAKITVEPARGFDCGRVPESGSKKKSAAGPSGSSSTAVAGPWRSRTTLVCGVKC